MNWQDFGTLIFSSLDGVNWPQIKAVSVARTVIPASGSLASVDGRAF